jgi:hypothetical protein
MIIQLLDEVDLILDLIRRNPNIVVFGKDINLAIDLKDDN